MKRRPKKPNDHIKTKHDMQRTYKTKNKHESVHTKKKRG